MRIARLVSVVPVDGVDESWKTLRPPQDFGRRLEELGSLGEIGGRAYKQRSTGHGPRMNPTPPGRPPQRIP
jgi:hypothetical protein